MKCAESTRNHAFRVMFGLVGIVILFSADLVLGQASFQSLGDLPGSVFNSQANATSADGSVVVGRSVSATGSEAYRWTEAGGMVGLGTGGCAFSSAFATSADGSVIVGTNFTDSSCNEAYLWTAGGGMFNLGDLPGGRVFGQALAVSADGAVAVGRSISSAGYEAFLWTAAGGMVGLGDLPGGSFVSVMEAISADGSVAAGSGNGVSGTEAVRWTSDGGLVGLGDLPGGISLSQAFAMSTDGSVIVGDGNSASGPEAFRWTQSGGMVGLGDLPGGEFNSRGFGTSGDGSIVVGVSVSTFGNEAFLWTDSGGMRSIQELLVDDYGLDLTGWRLTFAFGVSADGLNIVGGGINPLGSAEAWIVTLSPPVPPALDTTFDGGPLPKMKYLSFDPSTNGTRLVQIRVRETSTGKIGYVDLDTVFDASVIKNHAVLLPLPPPAQDWSITPLVNATGCIIQADTNDTLIGHSYEVTAIDPITGAFSTPLILNTISPWGNVVEDSELDIMDIVVEILTVTSLGTVGPVPAPHADVTGGDAPEGNLNITDIVTAIQSIKSLGDPPVDVTPLASCP